MAVGSVKCSVGVLAEDCQEAILDKLHYTAMYASTQFTLSFNGAVLRADESLSDAMGASAALCLTVDILPGNQKQTTVHRATD
jgi:hypothetical protein